MEEEPLRHHFSDPGAGNSRDSHAYSFIFIHVHVKFSCLVLGSTRGHMDVLLACWTRVDPKLLAKSRACRRFSLVSAASYALKTLEAAAEQLFRQALVEFIVSVLSAGLWSEHAGGFALL